MAEIPDDILKTAQKLHPIMYRLMDEGDRVCSSDVGKAIRKGEPS